MIAVAIGMVIIVGMALAMFATYDSLQSQVDRTREMSAESATERGREEISVELGGDGRVTIDSDWTEQSSITGLMVRCPDGTIITEDADLTVNPANVMEVSNATIHARLAAMGAGCPAGSDPAAGTSYLLASGHELAHGIAHGDDFLYLTHGEPPPSYVYAYHKNVTAATYPGTADGRVQVPMWGPRGLAADGDNIYVLQPPATIHLYDRSMNPDNWPGTSDNTLAIGAPTPPEIVDGMDRARPQGIDVHGSHLYVIDDLPLNDDDLRHAAHVYRYDKSTLTASSWQGTQSNAKVVQYASASGIAVDGSNIYVTTRSGNIYLHDMDMNPVDWPGSSSHIRGTGLDLKGITVDDDSIYVTDGPGVTVYGK